MEFQRERIYLKSGFTLIQSWRSYLIKSHQLINDWNVLQSVVQIYLKMKFCSNSYLISRNIFNSISFIFRIWCMLPPNYNLRQCDRQKRNHFSKSGLSLIVRFRRFVRIDREQVRTRRLPIKTRIQQFHTSWTRDYQSSVWWWPIPR